MKKISYVFLVLLVLAAQAGFAAAQKETSAWPDPQKTISMVVPFAAGGGTDLIFRQIAEEMKKASGATILVSNIAGAGSATGTNEVLNKPADGYTILASGTHTVAATLQGLTSGYKELDGIAGLNFDPFVVAVQKEKPWQNLKALVDDARSRPGKLSLGNAGTGGATGVASIGLNLAMGKLVNVTPFSGGSDLLASVLGGHVDAGVFSQSEIQSNKEKLRSLVVLYHERSTLADLAAVPTLKEAGYPEVKIPGGSFRSLSVRKGTPAAVKQQLADMAKKAFNSPSFQDYMKKNGLIAAWSELKGLDAYFDEVIGQYVPILKEAGLLKQ